MTTMAATELFKRLPDRIFSPLASENRHRFWSVLCALYNHRFGPDAPLPPSRGYLLSELHKFIENHITYDDAWVEEGGVSPETPLNVRAIGVFGRLQEAGFGYEAAKGLYGQLGGFVGSLVYLPQVLIYAVAIKGNPVVNGTVYEHRPINVIVTTGKRSPAHFDRTVRRDFLIGWLGGLRE